MAAHESPLHLSSLVPEPYVHLDNRALVLHDGRSCVMYSSSSFRWLAETIRVLLAERRATRQQGPQVFGGFLHDDQATIYAGTVHHLVTTTLSTDDLTALQERLANPV